MGKNDLKKNDLTDKKWKVDRAQLIDAANKVGRIVEEAEAQEKEYELKRTLGKISTA